MREKCAMYIVNKNVKLEDESFCWIAVDVERVSRKNRRRAGEQKMEEGREGRLISRQMLAHWQLGCSSKSISLLYYLTAVRVLLLMEQFTKLQRYVYNSERL